MTFHLPKGILLDLDDTILAFDAVADESWRRVLQNVARELSPVTPEQLFWAIKQNARQFWSDPTRHQLGRMNLASARQVIVESALEHCGIDNPQLSQSIAQQYGIERDAAVHPFPGALETIEKLRKMGIQLALVTNGSASGQRAKVERFQLARWFDCILIEGECGFGKPDHRIYWRALQELRLAPERVWMIGDNLEWEVWAPQRLGMKGIWVSATDREPTSDGNGSGVPPSDNPSPLCVIHRLSDLLPWMQKNCTGDVSEPL